MYSKFNMINKVSSSSQTPKVKPPMKSNAMQTDSDEEFKDQVEKDAKKDTISEVHSKMPEKVARKGEGDVFIHQSRKFRNAKCKKRALAKARKLDVEAQNKTPPKGNKLDVGAEKKMSGKGNKLDVGAEKKMSPRKNIDVSGGKKKSTKTKWRKLEDHQGQGQKSPKSKNLQDIQPPEAELEKEVSDMEMALTLLNFKQKC